MNAKNSYHYVKNTKTALNMENNKTACIKIFKSFSMHTVFAALCFNIDFFYLIVDMLEVVGRPLLRKCTVSIGIIS